jgi:phage gp29-like protein
VAATRWKVRPADESARAQEMSDEFEATLTRWKPTPGSDENGFEDMLYDLTDAFVTGVSVQEILWHHDGMLTPRATVWVHPRHLRLTEVGWIEPATGMLPEKFLVATHKGCTGSVAKAGILRPLAWWWCAQHFGAEWLLNFSQIFGQPFRWAKYAKGTPQSVVDTLEDLLDNMGANGRAVMPDGVTIEFKEAVKDGSNNPQKVLIDLADKQCDILILGQTLTTDVGDSGSRALGQVHENVREDRISELARWTADVLNYQLLPAWCRLNYGTDELCPILEIDDTERPDPDKMADRIEKARRLGIAVPTAWAREQLGIPEPEEGEEVLEAPAGSAEGRVLHVESPQTPSAEIAASRAGHPSPFSLQPSALPKDPTDEIAAARAGALTQAYHGSLAPVRRIIAESSSPEEAIAAVRAWYVDWSDERAAQVVEEALQIAAAAGAQARNPQSESRNR